MRMGLIAMSGVRVRDPDLHALGLTLPGFVQRGEVIASLPSLGLLTLAGLTPAEVEVEYVEVDELGPDGWVPGEYDAVAISSFTARSSAAYVLSDRYRRLGTTVFLGGLHVTLHPQEAAAHADAIVIGEGEPVWPELLADWRSGQLRPVYDARSRAFDLAGAPRPRFELLAGREVDRYTLQTQRGCPWDCEFCAASIRLAPGLRCKPPGLIQEEVRSILDLAPRPFLELADDNTFASKAHGRRVTDALRPFGLRWFTETDVSFGDEAELIERAADAGCVQVLIGLESPSPAGLRGVEAKRDWKAQQAGRYLRAIDAIQSRGISVNGCFVLGLDGSGPESFDGVLDFVRGSGLHEVQVTVQTPFPGTPLYGRLEAEGRLLAPGDWDRCTLFDVTFQPTDMSVKALRGGLRRLVAELYTDEAVAERRRRFRDQRREWLRRAPAAS